MGGWEQGRALRTTTSTLRPLMLPAGFHKRASNARINAHSNKSYIERLTILMVTSKPEREKEAGLAPIHDGIQLIVCDVACGLWLFVKPYYPQSQQASLAPPTTSLCASAVQS